MKWFTLVIQPADSPWKAKLTLLWTSEQGLRLKMWHHILIYSLELNTMLPFVDCLSEFHYLNWALYIYSNTVILAFQNTFIFIWDMAFYSSTHEIVKITLSSLRKSEVNRKNNTCFWHCNGEQTFLKSLNIILITSSKNYKRTPKQQEWGSNLAVSLFKLLYGNSSDCHSLRHSFWKAVNIFHHNEQAPTATGDLFLDLPVWIYQNPNLFSSNTLHLCRERHLQP